MRTRRDVQRGTILVVLLAWGLVIGGMCYGAMLGNVDESQAQRWRAERTRAMYVAEAGVADAVVRVLPGLDAGGTGVLGTAGMPVAFGGGGYWVTLSAHADGTATVVSRGTYGRVGVTVSTRWGNGLHPLGEYALFSGNRSDAASDDLVLGGTMSKRDVVNGKVYVAGDLALTGESEIHGDADVTGAISGNEVDGDERPGADRLDPPDLDAMDYAASADFTVDASIGFDAQGRMPVTDARHIFVKEFRSDLAATTGFTFTNVNYFLGDPWESTSIHRISVSAEGNRKVYYVDGNVWVEPDGPTSQVVDTPPEGTRITIVARGNIYFCDGLQYQDAARDALLFVALTDGESYTDLNGNNQHDPGEPILHDDGDGVYEGPAEGSGNILFGDPNGGPLGHVHGFMYADNYLADHVLNPSNNDPLPFEVTGFMSAGEQVQINREYGGVHAQMVVNFDTRAQSGLEDLLPGFPLRPRGLPRRLTWRIDG